MCETIYWLVLFVGLAEFVVLVLGWWLVCFPGSGVWLFVMCGCFCLRWLFGIVIDLLLCARFVL